LFSLVGAFSASFIIFSIAQKIKEFVVPKSNFLIKKIAIMVVAFC